MSQWALQANSSNSYGSCSRRRETSSLPKKEALKKREAIFKGDPDPFTAGCAVRDKGGTLNYRNQIYNIEISPMFSS